MKFTINCVVSQNKEEVWSQFNESLLKKLSPPFPGFEILYYEGQKKGDKLAFELDFILFKQKWESIILEDFESDKENYFVDSENGGLPMGLKKWHHKHRIIKLVNEKTMIRDEISFSTKYTFLDFLIFPLIYSQFLFRIPLYKKAFKKN
jgi:ligand-binding SRPBCC domain-containing protein